HGHAARVGAGVDLLEQGVVLEAATDLERAEVGLEAAAERERADRIVRDARSRAAAYPGDAVAAEDVRRERSGEDVQADVAIAFVGRERAGFAAEFEALVDVVLRAQVAELDAQHRRRKHSDPYAIGRAGVRAARERLGVVRRAALQRDGEFGFRPRRRGDQDRGGDRHDDLPHALPPRWGGDRPLRTPHALGVRWYTR